MVKVVVPTLNAADDWSSFAPALLACVQPEQVLIVDSESTDQTVELARNAGFDVVSITRAEFNHGGTRQMAAEMLPNAEILVYLTQDAVLSSPRAFEYLLAAFKEPQIAAACGRQLPRPGAGAIEAHAREFNYPSVSDVRSLASRGQLGIKAVFLSNSFAAYRRSMLLEVGGFPKNVIFGEDTVTAAKLLLAGYKLAYVAEASVYHSHAYSRMQELRRYFDIGVLHRREHWLIDEFGRATGEGKRFVLSQMEYLEKRDAWQIPSALVSAGVKLLGYRLGQMEARLPLAVKRRLSMHSGYWRSES